ncbi:hypothetical protein AB6A23_08170 [Paenibacillus tarimensis]
MSAARKKPPALKPKSKEEINKKALMWLISSFGFIIIVVSLLLIFSE